MGSIVSPWTASAQRGIHETCSLVILFIYGSVLRTPRWWCRSGLGSRTGWPEKPQQRGQWMSRRQEPLRVREGGLQPIPGRQNAAKLSRFGRPFLGNIFE